MVRGFFRSIATFVVFVWMACPVLACPLCTSETGERVRAALFAADFWSNLFVTLLPFSVFLIIVPLIHFGWPWAKSLPHEDRDL